MKKVILRKRLSSITGASDREEVLNLYEVKKIMERRFYGGFAENVISDLKNFGAKDIETDIGVSFAGNSLYITFSFACSGIEERKLGDVCVKWLPNLESRISDSILFMDGVKDFDDYYFSTQKKNGKFVFIVTFVYSLEDWVEIIYKRVLK